MAKMGKDVEMAFGWDVAGLRDSGEEINRFLDDGKRGLSSWAKEWQFAIIKAGEVVVDLGAKFGRFVIGEVQAGVEELKLFEQQLMRVGALGGQSADDLTKLSDWARDFALQSGYAATEIVKTTEALQSAQWSGEATQKILASAAALTDLAGGATTLQSSAKGLSVIMRNAEDQFSGFGDAADFARQIVNRGVMTQDELNDSLSKLTGVAVSANVSMDELGAMIATVTAREQELILATPQLRNIITVLAGEKGVGKAAELGITLTGSLTDKIRQLSEATREMATEQRVAVFEEMFGKETLQSASILTQNVDLLAENLEAMGDRAGAATEGLDEVQQSIAKSQEVFKAARTELQMLIAQEVTPYLVDLANGFRDMVSVVRENRDALNLKEILVGGDTSWLAMAVDYYSELVTGPFKEMAAQGKATAEQAKRLEEKRQKEADIAAEIQRQNEAYAIQKEAIMWFKKTRGAETHTSYKEEGLSLEEVVEMYKREQEDISRTNELTIEDGEKLLAALKKQKEERVKLMEDLTADYRKTVMKGMIEAEEQQADAQKEAIDVNDDYKKSIRDLTVEMKAQRMEQEAGTKEDRNRIRHVGMMGDYLGQQMKDVREGIVQPGGPTGFGADLTGALGGISGEQRGELQPLLDELRMMGGADRVRAELDVVHIIESWKEKQQQATEKSQENNKAFEGIAMRLMEVADTPAELNKVLKEMQTGLSGVSRDMQAFRSAVAGLSMASSNLIGK